MRSIVEKKPTNGTAREASAKPIIPIRKSISKRETAETLATKQKDI